jgi:hypothetical protein
MDFLINAVLIVFRSEVCLVEILSQEPTFEGWFGKISLIPEAKKEKRPRNHLSVPQADAFPRNSNSISKHSFTKEALLSDFHALLFYTSSIHGQP